MFEIISLLAIAAWIIIMIIFIIGERKIRMTTKNQNHENSTANRDVELIDWLSGMKKSTIEEIITDVLRNSCRDGWEMTGGSYKSERGSYYGSHWVADIVHREFSRTYNVDGVCVHIIETIYEEDEKVERDVISLIGDIFKPIEVRIRHNDGRINIGAYGEIQRAVSMA